VQRHTPTPASSASRTLDPKTASTVEKILKFGRELHALSIRLKREFGKNEANKRALRVCLIFSSVLSGFDWLLTEHAASARDVTILWSYTHTLIHLLQPTHSYSEYEVRSKSFATRYIRRKTFEILYTSKTPVLI